MKNKKAFTLIEIIIATAILSIAVFGVYKLIGENSKLINNSDNYLQLNTLFLNLEECIKNKKSNFENKNIGFSQEINFGNNLNSCELGNSNPIIIDNINYYLNSKITGTGANYIDFELEIEGDGVGVEKKYFRLNK